MSAALRPVHQSGCSDCLAADWTAVPLPTQGWCKSFHPTNMGQGQRRVTFTDHILYLSPQAVLACINVTSLRQMFLQFQDLPELWRISKMDFVREFMSNIKHNSVLFSVPPVALDTRHKRDG